MFPNDALRTGFPSLARTAAASRFCTESPAIATCDGLSHRHTAQIRDARDVYNQKRESNHILESVTWFVVHLRAFYVVLNYPSKIH